MTVKVKFLKVLIDMGPMTKIMKEVPAYDLPVLVEKYGSLEPEEEFIFESDEYKTLEEEVHRLTNLGIEDGTKQSFFSIAYGAGRAGVQEFEKAYKAALTPVKPKAKKAKKVEVTNEAETPSEKDPLG